MDKEIFAHSASTGQRISLVIPCYNEASSVRSTATQIVDAFRSQNIKLELVLVDNGSIDETGKIIDQLVAEGLPVVKVTVDVNRGYGHGILSGLEACTGEYVGFLCADSQVDAVDVARVAEIAITSQTPKLVKVRRRFRMDGLHRKVISIIYNALANLVFAGLHSIDINGNPKILPREYLQRMELRSEDWFLDPEVMIKSKRLGLPVYEFNVLGQMRAEGLSHVRGSTMWEFFKNLMRYRFNRDLARVTPLTGKNKQESGKGITNE
jgi:glycosyltransferase involved in cell wall biosynthesis